MDSEAPCCAHMRVIWTTDTDHHGITHGWWECSDCETQFVPLARAVRAEEAMPSLELLARADGLLSLVYHRYQYEKIPHDIREDMLRTSYELRAITDAMPRPATP